jgi:hypothetical protein
MSTPEKLASDLDRSMPIAKRAKPGAKTRQLIAAHNLLQADYVALRTAFNTLVTKLNADAGVTDTNYAAAAAVTSAAVADLGA